MWGLVAAALGGLALMCDDDEPAHNDKGKADADDPNRGSGGRGVPLAQEPEDGADDERSQTDDGDDDSAGLEDGDDDGAELEDGNDDGDEGDQTADGG